MATKPITPAQKDLILSLLREAEYDRKTVTLMHRNAGCPDKFQGRPVSEWLDSLEIPEASQVITRLQRLVA